MGFLDRLRGGDDDQDDDVDIDWDDTEFLGSTATPGRPVTVDVDVDEPLAPATPLEAFHILRNRRRVAAIMALASIGAQPRSRNGLARDIALLEDDGADVPEDVDEGAVNSVHSSLVQTHLPLLEDVGAVAIDENNELVAGPSLPAFEILLEAAETLAGTSGIAMEGTDGE